MGYPKKIAYEDLWWGNGPMAVAVTALSGSMIATLGLRLCLRGLQDAAKAYIPLSSGYVMGPLVLVALGGALLLAAFYGAIRRSSFPSPFITLPGPALAGLFVGVAFFPLDFYPKEAIKSNANCQSHLRKLGISVKMFTNESEQQAFPPLSSQRGQFMFAHRDPRARLVYPEYLSDLDMLYCPGADPTPAWGNLTAEVALDDQSYFYLGYRITNQDELVAFAQAYREKIAMDGGLDGDLTAAGITIRRLNDSDRYSAPGDRGAPSHIPVLIERPHTHFGDGSNVLYADGHVELIKMGAKWPVTEEAMAVLMELDGLGYEPHTASHAE